MKNILGKIDVSTQEFRDFMLIQYGLRLNKCTGLTQTVVREIGTEKIQLPNYTLKASGYCYSFKGSASWETIELNQDGTVLLPYRKVAEPSKELVEFAIKHLASKGISEDEVRNAFLDNSEEVVRLEIEAVKQAHRNRMKSISTVIAPTTQR